MKQLFEVREGSRLLRIMTRKAKNTPKGDPQGAESESGTRERLINAAGEVFAERGFRDATVREICAAAGANVAAVNYHFGDKDGLYHAVMRYAHGLARERYPVEMPGDRDPETQLRYFISGLLARMLDEGRPAWHGKLMLREMVEPTTALAMLVDESVRPSYLMLAQMVAELLDGDDADSPRVRMVCNSIVGQCFMYKHCQPMLRLIGTVRPEITPQADLAAHIAEFSLAAISGLRQSRRKPARTGAKK
jgi:AcrR family transcriptional regulator